MTPEHTCANLQGLNVHRLPPLPLNSWHTAGWLLVQSAGRLDAVGVGAYAHF